MPNRIIREAILSSEAIASLSWAEEVFYRRLMSVVDDYGRFEASPKLIRAKCYPLQTDDVKAEEVSAWMEACRKAGVLVLYSVAGKNYLEISKFQQQTRTASKCPSPDSECAQLIANEHLVVVVSVVEDVSEGVVEKATVRATPAPSRFPEFWAGYPNKKSRQEAEKAWRKLRLDDRCDELTAHVRLMAATDSDWLRGYAPMGSTYLNQARWEDVPKRPPSTAAPSAPSKTMQALQNLQDMKNGLDHTRNSNGVPSAGVIEHGSPASVGRIAHDG